jgi:hypothetical protein
VRGTALTSRALLVTRVGGLFGFGAAASVVPAGGAGGLWTALSAPEVWDRYGEPSLPFGTKWAGRPRSLRAAGRFVANFGVSKKKRAFFSIDSKINA